MKLVNFQDIDFVRLNNQAEKFLTDGAAFALESPGLLKKLIFELEVSQDELKLRDTALRRTRDELAETNRRLKVEISGRKAAEKALKKINRELETKALSLAEANTALKVLLKQREADKIELEEKVALNIRELILPSLEKIKSNNLSNSDKASLGIIESNLHDIVSPLMRNLTAKFHRLSPTELQVTNLIKQGMVTKEISELMNLAQSTIDFHRHNIRKKFGITNKKINPNTFLASHS